MRPSSTVEAMLVECAPKPETMWLISPGLDEKRSVAIGADPFQAEDSEIALGNAVRVADRVAIDIGVEDFDTQNVALQRTIGLAHLKRRHCVGQRAVDGTHRRQPGRDTASARNGTCFSRFSAADYNDKKPAYRP